MNEHPNTEPIEISVNGNKLFIDSGKSVHDLLEQLDLNHRGIAVERNKRILPRETHAQLPVGAGDCFEIVTLVGGG